jgi:hypothetical protein
VNRWLARAGGAMVLGLALLLLSSSGAWAADGSQTMADGGGGGVLGPFNTVETSEGAKVSDYELSGGGDGPFDLVLRFLMSGFFALARTVVGFECWLVDWLYQFPVIGKLSGTAQHVADAYAEHIVMPLGLGGVFMAWSFAFGLILVARGRAVRGFGEILLTLLISAIAATSLVRPDMMLGYDGPLQQAQRAALEAADITTRATGGHKSDANDPCNLVIGAAQSVCEKNEKEQASKRSGRKPRAKDCDLVSGPARDACLSDERPVSAGAVSRPITKTLTDTLVVQPYQLLQYGQLIDKSSPLYKAYKEGLDHTTKLDKDDPCRHLDGPGRDYCTVGNAELSRKHLEKQGTAGKAAVSYMSHLTWDRVLGALFVLAAALIMAIVVIAMAFAMIAAEFACVLACCVTYVVLMWSLLPGPNRAVLWKWLGTFASATALLFGIAVFIPLFGVAAKAVLADTHNVLVERLLLLDALAATALVMHRRMVAKGTNIGRSFAARMRFAKIGGSHSMGDQAAGMGMALAAVGAGGGHGGSGHHGATSVAMARGGASPAHAALAARRAKLSSGLAALGDGTGMPSNPLGALGEVRAEARRAMAPLSVPLRAAQIAWTGPPREPGHHPNGPYGGGANRGPGMGPGRGAHASALVIDGDTGEVLSDPEEGEVNPVGEQLRERISRTRGGRVLLGAGRLAWHTTVGAPAGWTRLRRRGTQATREMERQLDHYLQVRQRWGHDSRAGLRDAAAGAAAVTPRPVRSAYRRALEPLNRAHQFEQWMRNRRGPGGGTP